MLNVTFKKLLLLFAVGLSATSLLVGLAGAVVTITATKIDSLVVDNDGDGEVDPGDVISYTITISNSGDMDAENVMVADTIDANTTLVGSSLSVSPLARHDFYDVLGNVGITVPAANGVINNNPLVNGDNDPDGGTVQVTAAAGATTQGGAFAIASDGSFAYTPPPGFEGTDTFQYTITDDEGDTDVATVELTVSGMIWFVDASSSAGGTGTLSDPFDNLAGAGNSFDNLAADDPGDSIFVADGNYTCGLTLLNNQRLIGDGSSGTLAIIAGVTVPPFSNPLPTFSGTDPVLTSTNADCVTLASGNTVRGLTVGNTGSGVGITDDGGTVGSLTISEVTINGSGGGIEVDNGGTLAVSLDNLSASSSSDEGIDLEGVSGSFAVVGTGGSISTNSVEAIVIDGNPSLNINSLTFQSVSAQSTVTGILIQDTSGSFTINGTGTTGGSGGTIQDITQNGIELVNTQNITLRNMNLTNANTSDGGGGGVCDGNTNAGCNGAINMNTVTNVSLDNLVVNGTEEMGINGRTVTNFDLLNSTIQNAGNAINEHGLHIRDLLGTAAGGTTSLISNTTVTASNNHNVFISNDVATGGGPDLLQVVNSTFSNLSAPNGSNGFLHEASFSANMRLEISNSTFVDNRGIGLNVQARQGGQNDLSLTGSTFDTGLTGGFDQDQAMVMGATQTSSINFDIFNNTVFESSTATQIGATGFDTATFNGRIRNNASILSADSGGAGHGIDITMEGGAQAVVLIENNNISHPGFGRGISVQSRAGNGSLDVTLRNNTINLTGGFSGDGIFAAAGNGDAGESNRLCVNYDSNNTTANGSGRDEYGLEQWSGTTFQIQGLTPASGASEAQVEAFVRGTDNNAGATADVEPAGFGLVVNYTAATCATPVVAVPVREETLFAQADEAEPVRVNEQLAMNNEQSITNYQLPITNLQSPISNPQSPIRNPQSRPAGLASPLLSGETINVTLGTMNPDQEVTIEFRATVDDPLVPTTTTQVCNQAAITAIGINAVTDDPDTGTADDPTCTIIPRPDLTAVKKNDTGGTGALGVPFNWTIAITNSGTGAATFTSTEVILRDNLPAGATYGTPSATNFSGITNSGNISCTIVTSELECVAAGGPVTVIGGGSFDVVFAVTPMATGNLVNPSGGICTVDPDDVINEGDESNNVCSDTVTIQAVDLQISKDDGGVTVEPGELIIYTLTYTNAGDLIGNSTTITDTVPANTTFNPGVSTGGWACLPDNNAGSVCTLNVGAIAGGTGGTADFAVTVDGGVGPPVSQINNTVDIGDDGTNGPDVNPDDNTAGDTTPLDIPGTIIIQKVTEPDGSGEIFTFTHTITTPNIFNLADGLSQVFNNVTVGTYTVTEDAPGDGYTLSDIVCDDTASATPSSGDAASRTATINLDGGEAVTCTFTNSQSSPADGSIFYLPLILKKFRPPPDLTVTAFTANSLGGRSYRFKATVTNNGTSVTFGNNFHVVVYDVADLNTPLFFWGVQGSSFGAGQSVQLSQDYTFPGPVTTNLRAWADPFNVVVESDDANNTRDLPIVVTGLAAKETQPDRTALPSGPLPTPTVTP